MNVFATCLREFLRQSSYFGRSAELSRGRKISSLERENLLRSPRTGRAGSVASFCGSLRKALRTYLYPSEIDGERCGGILRWLEDYGFLYQNIASATSATVMIHRMMSLLRFFPSAIDGQEHTSKPAASAVLIKCRPNDLFRGRRARSRFTLIPRQLQDLPQMN